MKKEDFSDHYIQSGVTSKRKESVICKCDCRVSYKIFNKFGWGVCNRCGRKVMRPKDAFKEKLRTMMKGDKNDKS